MAEPPKSRLEREIDEILEKKSREPTPFRSHPRTPRPPAPPTANWQHGLQSVWHRLKAIPIALAYALVLLAMLVHDVSPLLALLLCTAAVAAIWVPGILRLTRPAGGAGPDVKYWRGRPYAEQAKSAVSRSPIDSLKRYFDRNR